MSRGFLLLSLLLLGAIANSSSFGFAPPPAFPVRSLGMHGDMLRSGAGSQQRARLSQVPVLKAAVDQQQVAGAVEMLPGAWQQLGPLLMPFGGLLALYKLAAEPIKELNTKLDKVETGLKEELKESTKELNTKLDKNKEELKAVEARLNTKLDKNKEKLNTKLDKVEAGLNTKLDKVEAGLNTKLDKNKEELKGDIGQARVELRADVKEVNKKLDKWIFSVFSNQSSHLSSHQKEDDD